MPYSLQSSQMTKPIDEAKNRLDSLAPQEWWDIANKLQGNPKYKQFHTEDNLHLLLNSLEIHLPRTKETSKELLEHAQGIKKITSDLIYALSTNQEDWFDELAARLETERRGTERF